MSGFALLNLREKAVFRCAQAHDLAHRVPRTSRKKHPILPFIRLAPADRRMLSGTTLTPDLGLVTLRDTRGLFVPWQNDQTRYATEYIDFRASSDSFYLQILS